MLSDLAEQELFSEQNEKKNTIPRPQPDVPAAYPKIDLKDIARYVSLYRNVAKKLFGEALDSAKKGNNVFFHISECITLLRKLHYTKLTELPQKLS